MPINDLLIFQPDHIINLKFESWKLETFNGDPEYKLYHHFTYQKQFSCSHILGNSELNKVISSNSLTDTFKRKIRYVEGGLKWLLKVYLLLPPICISIFAKNVNLKLKQERVTLFLSRSSF